MGCDGNAKTFNIFSIPLYDLNRYHTRGIAHRSGCYRNRACGSSRGRKSALALSVSIIYGYSS